MADYIRREDLMAARERAIRVYENANIFNAAAIREDLKPLLDAVVDVPAANVTEIIHCKDCAYFHPYPFETSYGSCKYHLGPDLQWEEKKETDYCSDAERLEIEN